MDKVEVIKKHQLKEGDTGSAEVQIALLTEHITSLTAHLKTHTQDDHSRRGLLKLVSRRSRLLKYLEKSDIERFRKIKQSLKLR